MSDDPDPRDVLAAALAGRAEGNPDPSLLLPTSDGLLAALAAAGIALVFRSELEAVIRQYGTPC